MLSWNFVVRQLDPRAEMQLDVFARWATAEIYIELQLSLHYSILFVFAIQYAYMHDIINYDCMIDIFSLAFEILHRNPDFCHRLLSLLYFGCSSMVASIIYHSLNLGQNARGRFVFFSMFCISISSTNMRNMRNMQMHSTCICSRSKLWPVARSRQVSSKRIVLHFVE